MFSQTNLSYDEVGNVIEQRHSSAGGFLPIGLYYSSFQLLFGISLPLTAVSFDLNAENSFGLEEIDGLVIRRPSLEDVRTTITTYEYLADGRVREIRRQGIIDSTVTLNQDLDCHEVDSTATNAGFLPAFALLSTLPLLGAGPIGIDFCESGQELTRDASGRVIEILIDGTPTVTFEYQDDLLVAQETRQQSDGTDITLRTESEFDDFGNLVGTRQLLNGTLRVSLSGEYECRLLSVLPVSVAR